MKTRKQEQLDIDAGKFHRDEKIIKLLDYIIFTILYNGLVINTYYVLRNDCGVTLASAKGRRKHEKRHCPKSSAEDRDVPNGTSQTSMINRYPSATPSPLATPISNISQVTTAKNPTISKLNSGFKCRFCGQLLTTLEGWKLHEKIQHASEISLSAAVALSSEVNGSH